MAMAVANRYAHALADVVANTGDYRTVLGELEEFAAAYRESADLREVFETPVLPLPEKIKLLEAVSARLAASRVTSNFLRVLVTNYRLGILEEVVQAFRKISNARLGIVEIKIFAAADLSDAEQEALRARFRELTRQQVQLQFHLDPNLLGGILAQIDSTVYDGSVRGQLELIHDQLVSH